MHRMASTTYDSAMTVDDAHAAADTDLDSRVVVLAGLVRAPVGR